MMVHSLLLPWKAGRPRYMGMMVRSLLLVTIINTTAKGRAMSTGDGLLLLRVITEVG